MRCLPLVPALVLPMAMLLACADEHSPTAPAADPPRPAFGAERFIHSDAFIMGGDPGNPLALQAGYAAGLTASDICADPFSHLPEGIGQIVLTPSGGVLIHTLGRGVNLVVYQYGGGLVTDPCQLVGAPIVGTGIGNFSFTPEAGSGGAIAVHVSAQGTIDLVSGGQARVFGTARITVRADGTLLFDEERVRLTPL